MYGKLYGVASDFITQPIFCYEIKGHSLTSFPYCNGKLYGVASDFRTRPTFCSEIKGYSLTSFPCDNEKQFDIGKIISDPPHIPLRIIIVHMFIHLLAFHVVMENCRS